MTYAEIILRKERRQAAALIQTELISCDGSDPKRAPVHLTVVLDHLLDPEKRLNDPEIADWCRWLVGGGVSFEDFAKQVRQYDNTAMCGLVWTADFVAFRCRTCGISQCMSLCADCFQDGDHTGHDFNMFKSQAGGACDCGDSSVMKESGFCSQHHGPNAPEHPVPPPRELMIVAEHLVPRIILRLIQHLRINTIPSSVEVSAEDSLNKYEKIIDEADHFLKLLHDFSSLGAAMRSIMTKCLNDKELYNRLTNVNDDSQYGNFMRRSKAMYEDALSSLPNPEPPREFSDNPVLTASLQHLSFLEELVFWTVKYEFPEKLVCLLLKMLPDIDYKEAFTRSFVLHYSRVSLMLVKSFNSDKLSNRVVHVSVQLFSNEDLALQMTENLSLLHIMVSALKNMMSSVLIKCELHANVGNHHWVVDCSKHVMRDHCYWPLVSDLNNVLSHPPIAFRFMLDTSLLSMWFEFLLMFQGMNMNARELESHIEFEPNTYYASFSGELEAAASPMWALVGHLKDAETSQYTRNVIKFCLSSLRHWFELNDFSHISQVDKHKVSFHLPLHRYFAIFVRQAVKHQGFTLRELLPDQDLLTLMMIHPMRVQAAFYEIMAGLWVRNGLQIKGQAMTYIQCHFCKSMIDADIYLLQLIATQLPPTLYISSIVDLFHIYDWLSLSPFPRKMKKPAIIDPEQEVPMVESCLTMLASLFVVRTNLGLDEASLARLEMVTLLCMSDKTHSMLLDHMPEKCGTSIHLELFDRVLQEVAQFREPQFEVGGTMQQGMYLPKAHVWEELFDPLYVLLRSVHRRDFQSAVDRFSAYAKNKYGSDPNRSKSVINLWPPWRLPTVCDPGFDDPRSVLHSRYAQGLIFNLLYKAVNGTGISEHLMSLAVYLLELSLSFPQQTPSTSSSKAVSKHHLQILPSIDLNYDTWFPTDNLSANLRHEVQSVFVASQAPADEPETSAVVQSMDVDVMSDDDNEDMASTIESSYQVETPSSVMDESSLPSPTSATSEALGYAQPLAITGPSYSGSTEVVLAKSMGEAILQGASAIGNELVHMRQPMSWSRRPPPLLPPPPTTPTQAPVPTSIHRTPIKINESLITLLLKLHSKLSDRPDSYKPICKRKGFTTTKEYRDSRIGDGCFFIEKVLDKISELDEPCLNAIETARMDLWPKKPEETDNDYEERKGAEDKRRRAKERQRRMMEQIAQQQRRFMQTNMETEGMKLDDQPSSSSGHRKETGKPIKQYDCVHCHQSTPSTEEKPVGLVVLLQSTSVLGHKHRSTDHLVLPSMEHDGPQHLSVDDTLGTEMEDRFDELSSHFDPKSFLLALNRGWEGGIHIQSCGHHVHVACSSSYQEHLREQRRGTQMANSTLDVDAGEYMCPMCRQLGNSVLPVPVEAPHSPVSIQVDFRKPKQEQLEEVGIQIMKVLLEETVDLSALHQSPDSALRKSMVVFMETMTKTTLPFYRFDNPSNPTAAVCNFVCSLARTNLECDLVQRGGCLVHVQASDPSSIFLSPGAAGANKPKSIFLPLFHTLAIHMKVMLRRSLVLEWQELSGICTQEVLKQMQDARANREGVSIVPWLLHDPITWVINFMLVLPMDIDLAIFNAVVQVCFNLQMVQILSRLSLSLSESERQSFKEVFHKKGRAYNVETYMGHVISVLMRSCLYKDEDGSPQDSSASAVGENPSQMDDLPDLEPQIQEQLLPFLRIVSLLRHYIQSEHLPAIPDQESEFTELMKFIELVPRDKKTAASTDGITWLTNTSQVIQWGSDYLRFVNKKHQCAKQLLSFNLVWKQPQLLRVPEKYDSIFQFYHKHMCTHCQKIPKDPNVCLLCGVMVCLRETCCRSQVPGAGVSKGMNGAVRHAIDCGGGTGVFLAVNSSTIVVVRGKRACIWGSIYLDSFGEEDKELKRGKPLFLNKERFLLLQHQWLTHRFDHTNRKWIWHRDQL